MTRWEPPHGSWAAAAIASRQYRLLNKKAESLTFVEDSLKRFDATCGEQIGKSAFGLEVRLLLRGRRRIPLEPGESIIGRDPGVGVHLDDPSISRRHARILSTNEPWPEQWPVHSSRPI